MSSCFISRISSNSSLSDAFCDEPNNTQHNVTPKSVTKKFNHLYDALSYSSLTEKAEKKDNCFPCSVCREKCETKQYVEIGFEENKCVLNLCYFCEDKDEIKKNWKISQ